jgi:UDP-3-O-[3-hydroxymyristoyl] glucosamine N-acyltransferase
MNFSKCNDYSLKQILDFLNLGSECLIYNKRGLSFEKMKNQKILGYSSLKKAGLNSLSFWIKDHSLLSFKSSNAGYVFVSEGSQWIRNLAIQYQAEESSKVLIQVADPYATMIELLSLLKIKIEDPGSFKSEIHPSAQVHPSALVEGSVGANSIIGPNCFIASRSFIDENSVVEANVTLYENVKIGAGSILQAGCVIGSRGFGFRNGGSEEGIEKLISVPHFGGVVLGENVQIGANSVVASGFLEPTLIGRNSCLDSLVQIAHNVALGENCYMASQSGIAGSTTLGRSVQVAGGAQIAGHLEIGDGVTITAKAGVTHSIKAGLTVSGYPAIEHSLWKKLIVKFRRL